MSFLFGKISIEMIFDLILRVKIILLFCFTNNMPRQTFGWPNLKWEKVKEKEETNSRKEGRKGEKEKKERKERKKKKRSAIL